MSKMKKIAEDYKDRKESESKGGRYKRVKAVTLPTKKVNVGEPIYITILNITIKESKNKNGEMKPLPIAQAVNLDDGEMVEIVLGAALYAQLMESYGDQNIKDKSFEITKLNKKEGKEYFSYSVHEIDPEEVVNE